MSCFENDLKKLISRMKSIHEDEFFKKIWEDSGNHKGVRAEFSN
jgi:hypothetical protein